MKKTVLVAAILMLSGQNYGHHINQNSENMNTPTITTEWDKTFPQSDQVDHRKVQFTNRFGITLTGDLYIPKNAEEQFPP